MGPTEVIRGIEDVIDQAGGAGGVATGRGDAFDMFIALERALDPTLLRPCLAGDVEIARFHSRWGGPHAVIHSPTRGTYLRLTGIQADLAGSLDGTRTVAELTVAELTQHGFVPDLIAELVESLHRNGFLTTPWLDTYALLETRASGRTRTLSCRLRALVTSPSMRFTAADRFVAAVYRFGGRRVFTPIAQTLLGVVLIAGICAFAIDSAGDSFRLLTHPSAGDALALMALQVGAIFVHELGHALAIRHAGRRILSAGVELYLASPAFFIDSSDMVMAGRRQRAVNAIAGPYAGCIVASLAALGAAFAGPSSTGEVLFRLAGITYLLNVINLIPFLELDGYWFLTDIMDTPDLRPRSLSFLRYEFPHRLRSRRALTRGEWGLLLFAILGLVFTVIALAMAWLFWAPVMNALASGLWDTGPWGRMVLVLLGVLVLGPLVPSVVAGARATRGWLVRRVDAVRFRIERNWRVEAAELIAALPHTSELSGDDLNEIAGRVGRRRFDAGEALTRQGDAADSFYLVRRGRCTVIERTADGAESVVAYIGPGATFGELALLEGGPRSATVRAETSGEVFVIDAATFQRILSDAFADRGLAPPQWAVTQVWQLRPFRNLPLDAVVELAARGQWVHAMAGDEIVRCGETGDSFYAVGNGQLQAERGDRVLGRLGTGDFFGEIALLHDIPRTATVKAITPARLFMVPRVAFDLVLRNAFGDGTLRAQASTLQPDRRLVHP